jgi:hypothetical protein
MDQRQFWNVANAIDPATGLPMVGIVGGGAAGSGGAGGPNLAGQYGTGVGGVDAVKRNGLPNYTGKGEGEGFGNPNLFIGDPCGGLPIGAVPGGNKTSTTTTTGTAQMYPTGKYDLNASPGEYNSGAGFYDGGVGPVSYVSDAGAFVLNETSLTMHCWGENPVVTAKLQLNGQDRFSEREGTYFDLVQPYQHHTRSPDTGINVYSFSLRPEEHQPSGTCNFSRIDNATLQLVLSNNTVEGTKTAKVRVYATNYNVLRIMSGMGGLAYSN